MSPDHKNLMLCWTEWRRFWRISVSNELFTSSSLHGARWFTGYYVQRFWVSVKRIPKDQMDREQRERESQITRRSHSTNSNMTLRESWQTAGFGAEQWLGRWQSHKQRGWLLLCSFYCAEGNKLLCSFQIHKIATKVPDSGLSFSH